MKLEFFYTTTACSLAAHIGLEECGRAFEARFVKLYKEEESDAYRQTIPSGKVPALIVDGVILTENVAILSFLAWAFPDSGLLPKDPMEAAQCLSLMAWFASTLHIDRRQARAPSRFTADVAAHPRLAADGAARFLAGLRSLDSRLAGKTWLVGDRFSAADGYALVFWSWALADELSVSGFGNLAAHAARVMERPAVQRALVRERHPLLKKEA